MIVLSLIQSALQAIFQAAVYLHTQGGVVDLRSQGIPGAPARRRDVDAVTMTQPAIQSPLEYSPVARCAVLQTDANVGPRPARPGNRHRAHRCGDRGRAVRVDRRRDPEPVRQGIRHCGRRGRGGLGHSDRHQASDASGRARPRRSSRRWSRWRRCTRVGLYGRGSYFNLSRAHEPVSARYGSCGIRSHTSVSYSSSTPWACGLTREPPSPGYRC
jgi:hypothetical protein